MVATQGVYKRENTRNTNAVSWLNNIGSLSVSPPNKTLSVLTTLSFAIKPVMNAVVTLQSSIPRGSNIGTIKLPKSASKLSEESVTKFRRESNVCKNHISIVAQKIIVKAFVTKPFAFV